MASNTVVPGKFVPVSRWLPTIGGLLLVSMSAVLCASAAYGHENNDANFRRRLSELQQNNPAELGRVQAVENCRLLLQDYDGKPCSAAVMMRIAQLYELTNAAKGFEPNAELALDWYRKAAATAEPGSDLWIDAQLAVAQRLRSGPPNPEHVKAARSALESLQPHVPADSVRSLLLALEFLSLCLTEGGYAEAETWCVRLLETPPDRVQIPDEFPPLAMLQADAARQFLLAVAQSAGEKSDRERRIRRFADKYPWVDKIQLSQSEALAQLAAWQDSQPVAPLEPIAVETPVTSPRTWFLAINCGVVCVLALAWALGKRRVRQ